MSGSRFWPSCQVNLGKLTPGVSPVALVVGPDVAGDVRIGVALTGVALTRCTLVGEDVVEADLADDDLEGDAQVGAARAGDVLARGAIGQLFLSMVSQKLRLLDSADIDGKIHVGP